MTLFDDSDYRTPSNSSARGKFEAGASRQPGGWRRQRELVRALAAGVRLPSPEEIEAAQTGGGGFSRATLASWGVPWPPPSGWRRRLEAQWRAANPDGAPPAV